MLKIIGGWAYLIQMAHFGGLFGEGGDRDKRVCYQLMLDTLDSCAAFASMMMIAFSLNNARSNVLFVEYLISRLY
jgi:hypothetical protein